MTLWVLLMWVDKGNGCPSFGVVDVDPMAYAENELCPGEIIFVRLESDNIDKRGRVLLISDNELFLQLQMKLLDQQDSQVKNDFTMCMRILKDSSEQMHSVEMNMGTANSCIEVNADSDASTSGGEYMTHSGEMNMGAENLCTTQSNVPSRSHSPLSAAIELDADSDTSTSGGECMTHSNEINIRTDNLCTTQPIDSPHSFSAKSPIMEADLDSYVHLDEINMGAKNSGLPLGTVSSHSDSPQSAVMESNSDSEIASTGNSEYITHSGDMNMGAENFCTTQSIVSSRTLSPQATAVVEADDESDASTSGSEYMILPNRHVKLYFNRPTLLNSMRRMNNDTSNSHFSEMGSRNDLTSNQSIRSTPQSSPTREESPLNFDKASDNENMNIEKVEQKIRQMYSQYLTLSARLEIYRAAKGNFGDAKIMKQILRHVDGESISRTVDNMPIDLLLKELNESSQYKAVKEKHGFLIDANTDQNPVPRELPSRGESTPTASIPQLPLHTDMVPIGNGYALVSSRLLNRIDWKSYKSATRKLLQAVFPGRILATHSLSGKQSPAFPNKPAKECLDPRLVDDIVFTVSERCGVHKRQIRTVITLKCVFEAKKYRIRQQNRLARLQANQNEENIPPHELSSDESS